MVLRRLLTAILLPWAASAQPSVQDACGVDEGKREDCGFSGINEDGCKGKGCCWVAVSPNPHNVPWCFKASGPGPKPPPPPPPPSGACGLEEGKREDCGFPGVNENSCKGRDCCWVAVDPNPHNVPWCFSKNGTKPKPPPGPPGPPHPASCDIFHNNQCQGNVIETDASFKDNRWYTPLKGDEDYLPSFQDYGRLVAYTRVTYSDDSLTSANVEVIAEHKDPSVTLTYVLGGKEGGANTGSYDTSHTQPLTVAVRGSDGSGIDLEPVDFRWNAPGVADRPGDYRGGQKGAIVELFGWPHADVEQECSDIAKMGYLGVKVFPAMEQLMSSEPFQNFLNPWYFMYQPVSYRLQGRMGSRDDLRRMIATCRSLGVRVYAGAVINHMTGGGNDANPHHRNPGAGCAKWGNKTSSLPGGHSPFYTQGFTYTKNEHTKKAPMQEFPAVPYGPLDFHCERALNSWTDPLDLNAGWLTGLTDLNTERDNVQERIAAYLTDLIGIGFSGFRIDAAKHIKPADLVAILSKFRRNVGGKLPGDFFTWLEVLLGGEADLLMCNGASGYNYGDGMRSKLAAAGFAEDEILKVKTWNSGYPKEPEKGVDGCDIGRSGLQRVVIQNDDHDQQNPGSSSRDMGNAGCVLIKGCDEAEHRQYEVQLFTNPAGSRDNNNDYPIRMVLSSFYWGEGGVQGIPDGLSDCQHCTVHCETCKSMPYVKAHDPNSKGYDKGAGQYTRAHRDAAVVNAMRGWMGISEQLVV